MSYLRPVARGNRRIDLVASVGQTVFTFNEPLFHADDLIVSIKIGGDSVFTRLRTGFSVVPAVGFGSGVVTFVTALRPLVGSPAVVVRLEGRRYHDRITDLVRNGAISTTAMENEADRVALTLLELRRDVDEQEARPVSPFDVDAAGPYATRSTHDLAKRGFVFLQTDDSLNRPIVFVKLSDASGDWSPWLILSGRDGTDGNDGVDGPRGFPGLSAAVATGSADALVAAFTPAFTSLADISILAIRLTAANVTASPTLTVDALPVRTIVKGFNLPLVAGDLPGGSAWALFIYDVALDRLVLLNPAKGVSRPMVPVRQTVLTGPLDAAGLPSFLPSTSASLVLTAQNIGASAPLIAAAALGYDAAGAIDVLGRSTSNSSWTCVPSTTNYLGVLIGASGGLTPFVTQLAPVYQWGGAPAVTAGQYTFVIGSMTMFLGDGTTANPVAAVFVGEADTNATTVTATRAYAYRGRYEYTDGSALPSAAFTKNHNLGVTLGVEASLRVLCVTASGAYSVGDLAVPMAYANASAPYVLAPVLQRNTALVRVGAHYNWLLEGSALTAANWRYRLSVARGW